MALKHCAIDQLEESNGIFFCPRSNNSFFEESQETAAESECVEVENSSLSYSGHWSNKIRRGSLQAINPWVGSRRPKAVKRRVRKVPSTSLASLIDSGLVRLYQKASYRNRRLNHILKVGSITREGITCDCCHRVFSISTFETHAGSSNHRPASNIILDDGRSLMDCQKLLHKEKEVHRRDCQRKMHEDKEVHCPASNIVLDDGRSFLNFKREVHEDDADEEVELFKDGSFYKFL